MAEQNKRRNPYSDVGLMIAISIFIVMLVKCLLFGITIASICWVVLCTIYFFLSYKYDSDTKIIKHSTTAFLCISIVLFVSLIFLDQNTKPKMHAFEGAKKDTVTEEEFKIKKEPTLHDEEKDSPSNDTLTIVKDSTNTNNEGARNPESIDNAEPSEQDLEEDTDTENLI